MSKYTKVLSLLLIAMFGLVACGGDDGANSAANEIAKMDINTPDGAFMASIAAMKSNDLASLIKNSLSEQQYNELVTEFPEADRQHVRQLIRKAHKEQETNKPPAAYRQIFKYLRDLSEN